MDAGDCLKKSFGEALKRARIEKGLSQQQLAEQLSVDRSSIANWETCRRLPDFYTITKLSALLQFDAAALLPVPQQEKKPLVMMLDDEKIILNGGVPILQKLLPKAEIVCFTKPSAALEYARSFKIDLALLDIEMGMVSGLGVCRELLTYHPRTNVIFLTAYSDYAFDAWSTGASGYLLKPLTEQAVREELSRLRFPIKSMEVG